MAGHVRSPEMERKVERGSGGSATRTRPGVFKSETVGDLGASMSRQIIGHCRLRDDHV
jgi:hypothetical protein